MKSHKNFRTDSCLDVSQHADVAALVTRPTAALAGQRAHHRQATHQLNTLEPPLSRILPIIIKHHQYTLLPSQIKGTTIKATNKIKDILGVNSKVWSCSNRQMPTHRNAVESLSMITRLPRVRHQGKMAAMESSDNYRRTQGQTRT